MGYMLGRTRDAGRAPDDRRINGRHEHRSAEAEQGHQARPRAGGGKRHGGQAQAEIARPHRLNEASAASIIHWNPEESSAAHRGDHTPHADRAKQYAGRYRGDRRSLGEWRAEVRNVHRSITFNSDKLLRAGAPMDIRQIWKSFFENGKHMDWDDLRIFETVASVKTLTAAASQLKLSIATVARRIDALEKDLGIQLVERTREGIRLTEDGAALVGPARAAAAAFQDVRRRAESRQSGIESPVKISATEPIAAELLAPALPDLLRLFPNLRVEIAVSNEVVSLASRDVDLALRLARPKGESLRVQKVASFGLGLYATPAYLESLGQFDIRNARLLAYDGSYGPIAEVNWVESNGLSVAATIRTSSTRALVNATLASAGVGILPDVFAQRHCELVQIKPPSPIPNRFIWLMSHNDLKRSPRHRAVRAWIIQSLKTASRAA